MDGCERISSTVPAGETWRARAIFLRSSRRESFATSAGVGIRTGLTFGGLRDGNSTRGDTYTRSPGAPFQSTKSWRRARTVSMSPVGRRP